MELVNKTIGDIIDIYNANALKGWDMLRKYTATIKKIANDNPSEAVLKALVEHLLGLQERIKNHEDKNRQYWRASALITNTDPTKNETFFADVAPLFLNGEINETELKTIIENTFGKATPIPKIKAPIIAAFCFLVESAGLIKRGGMNNADYCQTVCEAYKLSYTDRVRQNFSKPNKKNIKQVETLILPTLQPDDRNKIMLEINNDKKLYG